MRGKYDVPFVHVQSLHSDSPPAPPKPFFGPPRPQPRIVLLALDKKEWFDEMYERMLSSLKSKATVIEITTHSAAKATFAADVRPNAILATDQALSESKYGDLRHAAGRYVRSGGVLVFVAHFPSFVPPMKIKPLFASFGLPWEYAIYERTTHDVNPRVHGVRTTGLVHGYSQKAVHLKNVALGSAVYLPTQDPRVQCYDRLADSVHGPKKTPAALASIGRGKIGYLGDVNAEEETNAVLLAMCGLNV